ncbi:UDP-N-acetylmuramyl-tripeptide synthetase [Candidatus Saccharibacteria bacterium]|nr:UDP-N-acetylmuramyl-tripeptide synthetase [Candidatus Saccharibacteria bacterium]
MKVVKKAKDLLRPISPKPLINAFHYGESQVARVMRGNPTKHMVVIGIVGSKGKTTTANLLWAALSGTGAKVGQIGTANIRIGGQEELNKHHMTLPGAFVTQKYLKQMAKAGCQFAVMEVPSEGQTQYRHVGINFDVLVFTNVTKELMAAHNFRLDVLHKHNKRVFAQLGKNRRKKLNGKIIAKLIVVNQDAKDATAYSDFPSDKKVFFSVDQPSEYRATDIKSGAKGVDFTIKGVDYHINLLGKINVINAGGAIAAARELGVLPGQIQKGFDGLNVVPGRMEPIDVGQNFTTLVDYAHDQASMAALVDSAKAMRHKDSKVIVLLGAEGGGRDEAKRPEMGEIVAKSADYVVVSNVDPYEDDPIKIIEDVAAGAEKAGKKRDKDLFCIEDRREGIRKALKLARKDDLVFITGKGAEQSIVIDGKSQAWDDRKVVREELEKLKG